jgi:hypothetical protein
VSKAVRTINAEQAAFNTRARKVRVEAAPSSPSTKGRAYEGFLELPVLVVLGVLWVAGVVTFGSCVLVACAIILTLVWGW